MTPKYKRTLPIPNRSTTKKKISSYLRWFRRCDAELTGRCKVRVSQHFNFEFVDKQYETKFPIAQFGMSKRNKAEVILTKNE